MIGAAYHLIAGFWRVPSFRRGLIVLIAAGAAVLAIRNEGLAPAEAEFASLRADAIAHQTWLDDIATRQALDEDFRRLNAQLDSMTRRFAASVERSELVERVAAMSARAGTRIIHGANSFGLARNGVVPVLQDITVEGSYSQVRDFIGELAVIETLTLIRNAELTANAEGTLVRAQLRLVTYNGDWP